jgi:oligoendopeptidase F
VLYDILPRTGKSSVAYTDFLTYGRFVHGSWQKTIARVSASYAEGGLSSVNELVHEDGHAVHISAIRNRAAFVDWPDDFFTEAFADVSSWSVYEPAWQQKYLGAAAPVDVSLRALYGNVMLDVAWSLFELRMLRDPASDPNLVWTDITHKYLHIVPHPEYSWWALRVQLADLPGYMVNYGLGAVLTAELRQKLNKEIGSFNTGNKRWYPFLSEHLLRYGLERPVPELLREFFGRPLSVQALLDQIRRLKSTR